jgi:hypothetical protein
MIDLSKASPEQFVALGEDLMKMMKSPAVQEIAHRKITNVNDVQLAYDSADKYVSFRIVCQSSVSPIVGLREQVEEKKRNTRRSATF